MHLDEVSEDARTGNVASLFEETVRHHGDALALETAGRELTHAELQEAAERFAGGLADRGYGPGDRLLLYLPNCPEYLVSAIGAFRAGVVVSPVNPQYKTRELSYQLEDTDASIVLTHAVLKPVVEETLEELDRDPPVVTIGDADSDSASNPTAEGDRSDGEGPIPFDEVAGDPVAVERGGDDVALLPYTSGTTGRPKGVELTHRNFRVQLLSYLAGRDDRVADEEVKTLLYLPLYHITGFTHTAMQPLARGGTLFMRNPAEWSATKAMATIEAVGITHFTGVTAMYVDMVTSDEFGDYDLSSLVAASEGGAKMSVAVQREFEEVASVAVSEGYGLTETNGATHTQQGSTFGPQHGTIGQPLRMVDCKVIDRDGEEVPIGEEGELLVRGPQVMSGYHDLPGATEAAFTDSGYFRTGDVARRDSDNYHEIVDRRKHVIVTAGYNVYPSEVEALLDEHGAVAESAVVGIADERRNEIPVAYIVPRPGIEAGTEVTSEDLKRFCLDSIAEYKHPREVHFVEALPRTASGKVQKFELVESHDARAAEGG
ncbi:AMP-dependent synthetase [Halobacteriales archaeon QS_3_64_16]|nr:MAG: AMP-dependent synthetase [Halobacteriales archaeon QS_3_64_16]